MARTTRTSRRDLLVVGLGLLVGLGTPSAALADLAVANDVCGTLHTLSLADGTTLCTHGDDDHLLDLARETVAAAAVEAVTEQLAPIAPAAPAAPVAPALEAATPVVEAATELVDAPAPSGNLSGLAGSILAPAPATAAADGSAARTNRTNGAIPALPPVCVTDGVEGQRVEAVVVDVTDSEIDPATDAQVRRWAGQVDWTFAASAERDGGRRNVRWATAATEDGCVVDVARIRVTADQVDGFNATIETLREAGFNRPDRKYLAFVNVAQVCGVATVSTDEAAGFENHANNAAGWSRIDAPCWDTADDGFYSVAAHELAHNLGAVQTSAPNSNGAYHCNDEWDLMCYQQGENEIQLVCTDELDETSGEGDHNNRLLDCNGDDYFNASDDVAGHLATHWNVADSLFLDGAERPAPKAQKQQAEPAQDEEPESDGSIQFAGFRINPEPLTNLGSLLVDWAGHILAIILGRMA